MIAAMEPGDLTRRLLTLGNQLLSVAREVALSAETKPFSANGHIAKPSEEDEIRWLAVARRMYLERRQREKFLPAGLFGEPAWDILIDLYVATKENVKISTTSACIGSSVPPTTGLRWLQVLEGHGLIERECDIHDQRRTFVKLTDSGCAAMSKFFYLNSQHTDAQNIDLGSVQKDSFIIDFLHTSEMSEKLLIVDCEIF